MRALRASGRRRGSWRFVAVLAVVGILAAACGGDDDDPEAGPPDDDDISTTTVGTPTGAPINVMTIQAYDGSTFGRDVLAGMKAAIGAQNESRGGVQGRPIVLFHCDSLADANLEVQCARDGIATDPVVLTGHTVREGDAVRALLEQAGVPEFGGIGVQYATTNPRELQFAAPTGTNSFATPLMFAELGYETMVTVSALSTTPTPPVSPLMERLRDMIPIESLDAIEVDTTVADWAVVAQQVKETNADVVNLGLGGDFNVSFLNALQSIGGYKPAFGGCSALTTDQLTATASMLDGNCYNFGASLPITSTQPVIQRFQADMDAANRRGEQFTDTETRSQTTLFGYIYGVAVVNLLKAVDEDTEITTASVIETLQTEDEISVDGLVAPWMPTTDEDPDTVGFQQFADYFIRVLDGTTMVLHEDDLFCGDPRGCDDD